MSWLKKAFKQNVSRVSHAANVGCRFYENVAKKASRSVKRTPHKPPVFTPFFPQDQAYRVLTDVYVTTSGVILDKDRKVIWDSCNEKLFWQGGAFRRRQGANWGHPFDEEERARIKDRVNAIEQCVSEIDFDAAPQLSSKVDYVNFTHAFGFYAYGHFWDSVQRLFRLRGLRMNKPVILTSEIRGVHDFHRHLELLGFHPTRVFPVLKDYGAVFVPRLYCGELSHSPTVFKQGIHRWMMRKYIHKNSKIDTEYRTPGIFLDRNHAKFGRGISNNDEVKAYLLSRGFRILDGSEPVDEMLNAFHSARIIVGAHGAAFVNTVFCNAEAKIFEFNPENRPHLGLKNKFRLTEHYQQINLPSNEAFDIKIDIELLTKLLDD